MAGGDCLSNLPDDLLRHILHFAPAKEGASTGALARRWRFIWSSSGAVNLDSRSYDHLNRYRRRDVIMRDAREALTGAAAHGDGSRVTKFTFRYVEGEDDPRTVWESTIYEDDVYEAKRDMSKELGALLDSPVAGHVEELRLGLFYGPRDDRPVSLYDLNIGALSCSRALRVLHISKCMDLQHEHLTFTWLRRVTPPFPRLVELRLHQCCVSLSILQAVIDNAPHLATLHLDAVESRLPSPIYPPPPPPARSLHLRCLKITNLVLANLYCWGYQCQNTMEVDAPLLRCFAYEGHVRSLSIKVPPPDLARVDLRFHVPAQVHKEDGTTCRLFWKIVHNFSGADNINLNIQLSDNAYLGDCYYLVRDCLL